MKTTLLIILAMFLSVCLPAQTSTKGKIQEILSGDIFLEQLREVHETVTGDEGKAIPHFLEKTMSDPSSVSLADFRKEKERYYGLCREYNQILEDIVGTVNRFENLKEIKNIQLVQYKDRIDAIGKKFEALINDLNRYHREAAIIPILMSIYELGKPIVKYLISERIETIKRILTEKLRSLKLTPISWEAAEAVVASGQRPSHEEIVAKVGLQATNHYRSLNLEPGVTKADIDAAYGKLKTDYASESTSTSNTEIKEFYSQLTERVEAAKKYFDTNPPKAPEPIKEVSKSNFVNAPSGNSGGGSCAELKSAIQTALDMSTDLNLSKEQLVESLKKVLAKY